MNQEFVIDGTDIICNLGKERLLAPLLQLLNILNDHDFPFYCYFDADTRYKFDKDLDKQLYQSLIKFGLNDHFNQVTGGDADQLILKQAENIKAKVISTDSFRSFYNDFNWLIENKENRLVQPDIIAGNLRIDKLHLKVALESDTVKLSTRLLNALETERSNLHGTIDKYKADRQFGFIKRNKGEKKLFFHKKNVIDEKLDYTVLDTPVMFEIDVDKSGGIYYFCAKDIKTKTEENTTKKVEQLSAEKRQLSVSKEFLQKQAVEMKESFDRELQEVKRKNDALTVENKALQNKLENFTSSENELAKKIEELQAAHQGEIQRLEGKMEEKDVEILALRKELETLKSQKKAALEALERKEEESNELAMTIDFQEEKIQMLDDDLKAAIRLVQLQKLNESEALVFDQLKKDYDVMMNVLQQKNSKIAFLTNNLEDLQNQLERMSVGSSQNTEMERLVGRMNELETVNKTLSQQIEELEKINSQNKIKIKHQPAVTPQETTETEEEETLKVSLSDEAKRLKKKKPKKAIVEATKEELEIWWDHLEDQWKAAFNQAILSRGEILHTPDEDQLRGLFKRQKYDIVGSGILLFGLNQLSFKLTNLSGLKEMTQITELNLSGHAFTSLEGLEHLDHLTFLNCTSNKIETLNSIVPLGHLKTLIIQDNDLVNLRGAEKLKSLEYFNCLYNSRIKSIAPVKNLPKLQTLCVDNYKTIVRLELEELMGKRPGLEVRNV